MTYFPYIILVTFLLLVTALVIVLVVLFVDYIRNASPASESHLCLKCGNRGMEETGRTKGEFDQIVELQCPKCGHIEWWDPVKYINSGLGALGP